ncbi:caspase family protein [Dechloromonas sp. ZY10]|uniref:caspase family protein n=1 Tax=Dechloromonas aquae TaxID=2664436 RepID=UPI0035282758
MARREQRSEMFKEALGQLKSNPKLADVEECSGRSDVCVPPAATIARVQASTVQPMEIGRRVAYLIANSRYQAPIPELETPRADIEVLGQVLRERMGYDVKVLHDASKAQIIRTLQLAGKTTGQHQSVLVMYAGHGYQISETRQGYWIPVDGNSRDPAGWVSNSDITKLLTAIPAKQVILISDSCYSGTLANEQSARAQPTVSRSELLARRSVLALTSGGEEPVSDEGRNGHSIFAAALIERLQGLQENTTVGQLFDRIRDDVTAEYPQVPQLGAVQSAGHVAGGDFLIDLRR